MVSELLTGMICFVLGFAARGAIEGREKNGGTHLDKAEVSSDLTQAIQAMAEPFCGPNSELGPGWRNGVNPGFHGDRADEFRPGRLPRVDGQKYAEKAGAALAQLRPKNQKIRQETGRAKLYRVSREGGGDYLILARTPNEARLILMQLLGITANEAALHQVEEKSIVDPPRHPADL